VTREPTLFSIRIHINEFDRSLSRRINCVWRTPDVDRYFFLVLITYYETNQFGIPKSKVVYVKVPRLKFARYTLT